MARDCRAFIVGSPLLHQQLYVASRLDERDRRGLLRAFKAGEPWAVAELTDMDNLDFWVSWFVVLDGDRAPQFF